MGRRAPEIATASYTANSLINFKSYWASNYTTFTHQQRSEVWELPFEKKLDEEKSFIHVEGLMCGEGHDKYPYIGMYFTIDDIGRGTDSHDALGGIHPCGPDGNGDREGCLILLNKTFKCSAGNNPNSNMSDTFPSSGLTKGSHNINIGWDTRNNATSRLCVHLNPDSSREGRHQDTHASFVTIYEMTYQDS